MHVIYVHIIFPFLLLYTPWGKPYYYSTNFLGISWNATTCINGYLIILFYYLFFYFFIF